MISIKPARRSPELPLRALGEIRKRLPPGYRLEAGGAFEENAKAQASIAAGLPMTLAVVLAIPMIQLKSCSRSYMVLLTAVAGV